MKKVKKSKSSKLIDGGLPAKLKLKRKQNPFVAKEIIDDSAEVMELTSIGSGKGTKGGKGPKKPKPPKNKKQPPPQLCSVYQVFPGVTSSTTPPTFLVDSQTTRDDFISGLANSDNLSGEGGDNGTSPSSFIPGDEELQPWEIVVDKNGLPRQAGATLPEGEFVTRYKERAEQSLFIFIKGIIGRFFLTPHFHRDICRFIQTCPPYRKLVLMPREHAKCLDTITLTQGYIRDNISSITNKGKLKEDVMIMRPNGIKGVWRVTTTSGRELCCTENHPFLRWENEWISIKDGLSVEDWIGVVRKGSFGEGHTPLEAAICGWMVADGDFVSSRMTAKSKAERLKFTEMVNKLGFETSEYIYKSQRAGYITVKKAHGLWIKWGLDELRSADKFVPDFVLKGDEDTIRAFLYELIRHDGTKFVTRNTTGRAIEYTTISERLAFDVQHLLIKFGLHAKLRREKGVRLNGVDRPDYEFYRINFTDYAGIVYRGEQKKSKRCVTDVFPPQWRDRIPKGAALRKQGIRVDNQYASTREKVKKVAELINDCFLLAMCNSDIKWEQIISIEYLGERDTTSVETGEHTLTFGDIISHNTTIVAGGLPPHILIQPAKTNIYFPGMEGSECRILLAGETETMAKKNLRVVQSIFEENKIFRAFWPHRCWEYTKQAKAWSSEQMIIPRSNEWPDPTIRAIGVGGAVTGARPNVMIKDDLVSFKAANSDVVMDEAIEWHKASRALLDTYEIESGLSSLEFIIGCLVANSMVTMEDGTKKRICDVKVGEWVWQATESGDVQRAKVENVIPQGVSETWTISTTTHKIKATGNHPFLISTDRNNLSWKRADQLREGDLIVAHKKLYSWGVKNETCQGFEVEFCWLFGFMLGDGWINNRESRGYVCFSPGIDEEQNQRVLNALNRYVPCNKWTLTKGGYYRTDSVKAAQFFTDLDFHGTAKTKRLPIWVYHLNQEQKIQFLRGFCDADGGWQNHQTWRVEISNKELLEDLRHVACLCGVRVGRLLKRERIIQAPNSPRPIRSICFSSSFNFLSINRNETVNKNLYGGLNVGRDTKLSDELRFERVVEVKRNKIAEEVWDLTVSGNHSFFANGLAVHNTRWSVFDLYSYIIDNDPSVEVNDERFHKIVRDGKILWREKYTMSMIEQLQREHGSNFYLLYLNSAADPELTDFDMSLVRPFTFENGIITFDESMEDEVLRRRVDVRLKKLNGEVPPADIKRGSVMDGMVMKRMLEGGGGFRLRGV